jgi:hypothetical protein
MPRPQRGVVPLGWEDIRERCPRARIVRGEGAARKGALPCAHA